MTTPNLDVGARIVAALLRTIRTLAVLREVTR